jgi:hypothetical protein
MKPPVVIATSAAGAIPYYSDLPSVDQLGLNDLWIARHGPIRGTRPGHQRSATARYLKERGVHLVLGHPKVKTIQDKIRDRFSLEDLKGFGLAEAKAEDLWESSRVLGLPLAGGRLLLVLYLRPHDGIERLARLGRWKVWDIEFQE